MKAYTGIYPIRLMCRVLLISVSRYYAWLSHKPTNRVQQDIILAALVKAAHIKTRETYGIERLHAELVDSGVEITKYKVRSLRSKLGLRCKQPKRLMSGLPNRFLIEFKEVLENFMSRRLHRIIDRLLFFCEKCCVFSV